MGLQAVIFDLDGTIAETADIHRAAFNRSFQEFGLNWHWDREIFSQLTPAEFTLPKLRLFAKAAQNSGLSSVQDFDLLAKIASRKAQYFCKSVKGGAARLRPGVARLMSECIHEGLIISLVSTSSRAETETLLNATLGFKAHSRFSSILSAENAGVFASQRVLYRETLRHLGTDGSHCVAIDDNDSGTNAAINCNISVVATPGLYTSSHQFNRVRLVLSDLGQPAEPYSVLRGDATPSSYVTPSLLRAIIRNNAVAA